MDSADLTAMPRLRVTPVEGRRSAVPEGHLSARLMSHGSMEVRWYGPNGHDPQTPHDRDELYVVVAGTGMFIRAETREPFTDETALHLGGEERITVEPGDAIFVPAGTHHHFEATSADFGCWMIFYGPEGGERP